MSFKHWLCNSSVLLCLSVVPLAVYGQASTNNNESCVQERSELQSVSQRYQSTFQEYQQEGDQLKNSPEAARFNLRVTWADIETRFATPSVTMRDQRITFGVPQITMRVQKIIFHTPSVRMERVKTGQYPEFICRDNWINIGPIKTLGPPICETRWSDTFADVPITFMQEQSISANTPEFRWDDVSFVMSIPELFMQGQRIVIGVPQFTLNSVLLDPEPLRSRAEDLKARVDNTREQQSNATRAATAALFACYRTHTATQKESTRVQFDAAINQLNTIIEDIRNQGADPSRIPGQNGTPMNLIATLEDVLKKRDDALAKFDSAARAIDESEASALSRI